MGKLIRDGLRPASDPIHRQSSIVLGGLRGMKKKPSTAASSGKTKKKTQKKDS